jgi:hypothetical protein
VSALEDLRGLAAWIDAQSARVLEVGSTCALGGDAAWDALLAELGVRPLPPDERARHLAEGVKRPRGALPIEVRWAAAAIHDRARPGVRALDLASETPAESELADRIERRLNLLVDELAREHLGRVSPAAPTTASIFANARATTPKYGAVGAGMGQMKCVTCGAPRKRTEGALTCVYCGGRLE